MPFWKGYVTTNTSGSLCTFNLVLQDSQSLNIIFFIAGQPHTNALKREELDFPKNINNK